MRIVLFEDNGGVLYAAEFLREEGHDVWRTMDFRDIMSWVEFKPGAEMFDAWIFDLNVPAKTLKRAEVDERYDENKHHSPSLFFINHYLLKKNPDIKKKIILFSAYFSIYERNGWDLGDFLQVDKHSRQAVDDLLAALRIVKGRSK